MKGWAEPIVVWQVVGTSGVESRFEALHATGLTVVVGRDEISIAASALAKGKVG